MSDIDRSKNMMQVESGSFRDRNGRIFYANGVVYRGISTAALEHWQALSSTKFFREEIAKGSIIHTEQVNSTNTPDVAALKEWAAVLKHQKIPFVTYPYEWPFGMLKDAALLQLDLLGKALNENMTLKDASSFNVQWEGSQPVFIDVPSFERFAEGTPWVGYRQFCEMFLYPLMLQAYKGVEFHPLLRGRIDGITPEECNNLMSRRDLFRGGVFMHVYLQSKLQAKYGESKREITKEIRSSGFSKELITANVRGLKNIISKLEWKRGTSEWSHYAQNTSYTDQDSERKAEFVRAIVGERKRNLVWDLGCNTGRFSRIAAENSSCVVAMDSDHLAVEHLYRELRAENNHVIVPLKMNLADPSPAQGWLGKERKDLTERGTPDLVLALALIHHIVISANIPLKEFIDWLASFKSELVIEFITKEDPMVKKLLRNKEDQYADYALESFERVLRARYATVHREALASGTRYLYYAKDSTPA
jgi:SAM-dependent methyltransferase